MAGRPAGRGLCPRQRGRSRFALTKLRGCAVGERPRLRQLPRRTHRKRGSFIKILARTLITTQPFANVDGVEADGRGGDIVTDWSKGQILQVSATGDSRLLRQLEQGTADLTFVPESRIVIVPHLSENKVASYDLSDVIK